MAGFFFTGEDSLTPDAIDRKRILLNALRKDNLSTAPVQHWTQAAARVMGSLGDTLEERQLNRTEKQGVDENKAALLAAFGLGGAASPPAPSAGAALPASQPAPATIPSAPQVQQQPLLPNRPQMPPMFENTAGPGPMAPDGTPMPPIRPANPGAPSPFGSLQMPVNPVPIQQAGPAPLWTQPGLTKGLPQIGQQQLNPTLAYNEPGPAAPMGGTPNAASTFARMLTQESGNRQFRPDGSPVTSSAGAIGIAQVMPGTGPEAARLAGLPWDENRFRNDANYNRALGQAYYQAQVKRYGDPTTAAAAYNAGPGNVDKAIRQQQATGQPFTDFLPKETQGYIAAVGGPSGGAPVQTAQAGQPSQNDAPSPNAAQAQFNVPGAPAQSGSTPQAAALLQALSSPWAARNPMLAQLGAKVLGEQLTGNKLTYQTDGDGNIIALDPTGRRPPQVVYQAAVKPMTVAEGSKLVVRDPSAPGGYREVAQGGDKGTPDQKNYEAAVKGGFKGSFGEYQIALRRAASAQPENTFNVEISKGQAKHFTELASEYPNARTDIANVKALREQTDKLPGGFMGNAQAAAVRMGIKVGPNASAVEAADAILNRLTPAMRQGMPGAASDRDVAMFRGALPSLGQTKEGQKIIMDTMEGLATYKLRQAEIAQQVAMGKMKPEQGMEELAKIADPFEQFKAIQGSTQKSGSIIDEARAAIANGAPPDKVRARLKERGIDPGAL